VTRVRYLGVVPVLSLPRVYVYVSLFKNSLGRVAGYLYAQVRGGKQRTVYVGKVYEGEREPRREEVEVAARRLLAEGAPVGALVVALERAYAERLLRGWLKDLLADLARRVLEEAARGGRREEFSAVWPPEYDDARLDKEILERYGEEGAAKLVADAFALQHLEAMWEGMPQKGSGSAQSALSKLVMALREAGELLPVLRKLKELSKRGEKLREMLGIQRLGPIYRLIEALEIVGVYEREDPETGERELVSSPTYALKWALLCSPWMYEVTREGGELRERLSPYDGEERLLACAREISGIREERRSPPPDDEVEEGGELTVPQWSWSEA